LPGLYRHREIATFVIVLCANHFHEQSTFVGLALRRKDASIVLGQCRGFEALFANAT